MFSTDFGLGTLISNLSNRFGTGKMLRHQLEDERRGNYIEDLMARQEAWKAAGLHPLVGMGIPMEGPAVSYSSAAPSPRFNFQTEAKVDPDTQRLRKAQADMAELQVEAARNRLSGQPGNAPMPSWAGQETSEDVRAVAEPGTFQFRPGAGEKLPGYADVGKVKPSESISRSSLHPYMTATGDPAMREYTIPLGKKGMPMMLPYSNEGVSETLENVKTWMWPFVYWANVKHYGRDWADELWDNLGLPRFSRRYRQVPSPAPASSQPSMGISP